jgi:hypothetical protein
MVGATDTTTVSDCISIEMQYGIVVCDSIEVTDQIEVVPERHNFILVVSPPIAEWPITLMFDTPLARGPPQRWAA